MAGEQLVGPLPDGWEYTTLGAACERGGGDIQTGPFGSQLHASDYVPIGVPSIMPLNIGDNRIVENGIARITQADAQRLSRYLVRKGDIVYSRRGDVERRALVREREDGWLCGTGCLRVRLGKKGVDPRYAAFYLGHPSVREWVVRHAHGATMPNLNTSILAACPFLVPPKNEQRAIAHILGTLDDKIELNRWMNGTLEAMARALFKSWFVDFDPVRAKVEGRPPARMDVETAALFPDSFIESELGLLPKGWDIKPVREIIEDLFDGPHATPAEASEGAVYLGIKNLTGTQIDLTEIRYISELDWPQWTKRVVPRPHDIVFTYEATLGAFAIVPADLRCCLGRRLALVRPKTGQLDYCFLFHTFVSKAFQELLMAKANQGSTVNRIPLIDFPKYPVIWPARQLIDRFHRLAEPLWSRIHQNQAEARKLVTIRDTLLPKLISGELQVKDAERALTDTPV